MPMHNRAPSPAPANDSVFEPPPPRASALPSSGTKPQPIWRDLVMLAVAAGLIAVIRVAALGANSTDLFYDEAQYWAWSLEPAFGYYSKPPLIAWLIAASGAACGDSEFCVRLPSPLVYTVAAFGVFWAGIQLYGPRVALLSALAFLTLPGVSLSSGIISTDVPLLAAWAFALAALIAILRGAGAWAGVVLGLALGLGLNAKYAMAYFVLCLLVYAAAVPEARRALLNWRILLGVVIGAAAIVPNVLWNIDNSFATLSHTADNANWGGRLGNPEKALEFFAAQFGVFGPILFAALLMVGWRAWREGLSEPDRLLACFAVPVLLVVLLQAFLSRAHANWAAVSYVAATLLVVATFARRAEFGWLKASFAVNIAIMAALILGTTFAGRFSLPGNIDPFTRTLGWSEIAAAARSRLDDAAEAAGARPAAIVTDTRALSASLIYYLRDQSVPVLAWRDGTAPSDHFELTRPYDRSRPEPVLVVGLNERKASEILARFETVVVLGRTQIAAGLGPPRVVSFHLARGFRG